MVKSRSVRTVAAFLVLAFGATALTSCQNGAPNPWVCAAIGGLAGAGGAGVAATHIDGSHDDEYIYPIGLAGGLIFGAAGYFICKALAKEEEAPPPPPPAPRAAPAPPPSREKIVLRGVNFDFDKANIRPDAAVILDEAVHLLGSSGPSVSVEGHTDAIGTDAYNQGLSERRANSVKKYLVEHGVDGSRLSTVGYGESRPIASNETREGRALNRRVELNVEN
jgi:outer membrane protein OmpA-like peptidoglycan-associated protein